MSTGIGQTLREAREAQGRSQQDAAQSLRVRSDYVQALEDEHFDVFGADTYARGHLRNYARFLGLDPVPLLETYDREVRADDRTVHHVADAPISVQTRDPLPRWVTVLGLFVVVLGAIALIGTIGGNTPPPADPELAIDPTPSDGASTPDDTATEPSAPGTFTPTPSPSPSPSPTFEGVEMLMVVEADCWVDISVDGQQHPRSQSVLAAGETLTLQGDDQIDITFGNAGGVLVEVNGESYGRPGGNGAVVEQVYGPDGPVGGAPA